MQKSELDYLKFEKRKEGKSYNQIDSELDFLVGSQVEFRKVKREINQLKRIIERKDNEINKLKDLLEKNKEKNFKKKFKELQEPKEDKDIKNNLKHFINRILNYVTKDVEFTKSDVSKELNIPITRINDCLNLLKKVGKIDFRIDERGIVRYRLI